jgi:hypothetical protein
LTARGRGGAGAPPRRFGTYDGRPSSQSFARLACGPFRDTNRGFCPINSVAWADAHRQKPRPSTTLTTKSGSTPITRNEVCMKPGNASHPNMHGLGRYCNCWRHYTAAGRNIRRQNDSRARLPTRLPDMTLIAVPIRCSRNTAHPTARVGRLSPRFVLLLLRHDGSRADRHTHKTSPHQHEPTQPNSLTVSPDEICQRMSVPVGPMLSRVDHKRNSLPHHRRFRELSRFPSPTADGRSTAGQSPRPSTRTRQGLKAIPPRRFLCFVVRLAPESMVKMRKRRRSLVTRIVSTTATP